MDQIRENVRHNSPLVKELLAQFGTMNRKQDLELLFMVLSQCETVEDFQRSGIPIIEDWVGRKKVVLSAK